MCVMPVRGSVEYQLVEGCEQCVQSIFLFGFFRFVYKCGRVRCVEALIKGWPTCHNQRKAQCEVMFDLILLLVLFLLLHSFKFQA